MLATSLASVWSFIRNSLVTVRQMRAVGIVRHLAVVVVIRVVSVVSVPVGISVRPARPLLGLATPVAGARTVVRHALVVECVVAVLRHGRAVGEPIKAVLGD